MSAHHSFKVIDGPSKDRLIDGLKYAFDEKTNITLTFTGEQDGKNRIFSARVTSVEYESGNDGALIIGGYVLGQRGTFHGYYHATTRTGILQLIYGQ